MPKKLLIPIGLIAALALSSLSVMGATGVISVAQKPQQKSPAGPTVESIARLPYKVQMSVDTISPSPNDSGVVNDSGADEIIITTTKEGMAAITLSIVNLDQLEDNFKYLTLSYMVTANPQGEPSQDNQFGVLTLSEPTTVTYVSTDNTGETTFGLDQTTYYKAKEEIDDTIPIIIKVEVEEL